MLIEESGDSTIRPLWLPSEIMGFVYVRVLSGLPTYEKYTFALYCRGEEYAIIKAWNSLTGRPSGKRALLKEIKTQEVLTSISEVGADSSAVRIPKYYSSNSSSQIVWMLTEYIQKENNRVLTFDDFLSVREYMRNLGYKEKAQSALRRRSTVAFLFGFLYVWCRVLVRSNVRISFLHKLLLQFFRAIPLLMSKENWELSHLDLKPDNVICNNGLLYVIDFHSTAYAPKMLDLALSLNSGLLRGQLSESLTANLLQYTSSTSIAERRLVNVFFCYGLFIDLVIERENRVEDNYKYLRDFSKLISYE